MMKLHVSVIVLVSVSSAQTYVTSIQIPNSYIADAASAGIGIVIPMTSIPVYLADLEQTLNVGVLGIDKSVDGMTWV